MVYIQFMVTSNLLLLNLLLLIIYCLFLPSCPRYTPTQEYIFTDGFEFKFHLNKQSNMSMYLVPSDDDSGATKDCLVDFMFSVLFYFYVISCCKKRNVG